MVLINSPYAGNCDPCVFDSVEEKVVLSERNEALAPPLLGGGWGRLSLKEEKLCFTGQAEPQGLQGFRVSRVKVKLNLNYATLKQL